MFGIEVTPKDGEIEILCPYDAHFVRKIKQLGGKWAKPAWVIASGEEAQARALLRDRFGTDGTPEPTLTLLIHLDHTTADRDDSFRVGPVEVLRKFNRDRTPTLGKDCIVMQGELFTNGGSRNNPRITYTAGTVIKAAGIPVSVAQKLVEEDAEAYQILAAVQPADTLTAEELSLVEVLKNLDPIRLRMILQSIK